MNVQKVISSIQSAVKDLNLDLTDKVVLTEAGTNYYLFTPLIPLFAGAKHVFVWTKDSSYGSAESIEQALQVLLKQFNFSDRCTIRKNQKNNQDLFAADIITNSGAIRPIDADLIGNTKPGAVIPLMFEAWEIRETDIDIEACRNHNVRVAGTWENHPQIQVFEFAGLLPVKFAFEAGLEVFGNQVFIWSDDHFGEIAAKYLTRLGAKVHGPNISFSELNDVLPNLDWIYLCDYSESRPYFGENGLFDLEKILEINPNLVIIHLYGNVDTDELLSKRISVYPPKKGRAQVMTETLAYLGHEPIIKLQVAGFKVGMELISGKMSDFSQPVV